MVYCKVVFFLGMFVVKLVAELLQWGKMLYFFVKASGETLYQMRKVEKAMELQDLSKTGKPGILTLYLRIEMLKSTITKRRIFMQICVWQHRKRSVSLNCVLQQQQEKCN